MNINHDAPLKVMLKDLSQFTKFNDSWLYTCNDGSNIAIKLSKIHIQGEINKTAGFLKEILIVSDGSGKAKVTRGAQVPGDLSWLHEGVYCSIIGNLIDNGKLPHISAIKIARINNTVLRDMWPLEVAELKYILLGKGEPELVEETLEDFDY
ncbi:hypothetical protein RUM44_011301 [Polyplax serrata]|uniref:RecQ-mediated genome instability protein 2 n=1 Tax=Polyplax serrata TaxID=468196 RepID=A0ABR1APM2_POLSC